MNLNSPAVSEMDSLSEKKPEEKFIGHDDIDVRNYSSLPKCKRTDLYNNIRKENIRPLSNPKMVNNLSRLEVKTPDFTMTQSLYEHIGHKEQIEKMEQQSKLMNLIASEKAAELAQKKKLKEMKMKIDDQRKKNKERQRNVEEKRMKLNAEDEEKKKKILSKLEKIMGSQCSLTKSNFGSSNGFLVKRPVSSTGNILGFGSSTPRLVCFPISRERLNSNNSSLPDLRKDNVPMSSVFDNEIKNKKINIETRKETGKIHLPNSIYFEKTKKITPKSIKKLNSAHNTEVSHKKAFEDHFPPNSSIKETAIASKAPRSSKMTEDKNILQINKRPPKNLIKIENKKIDIMNSDNNKINTISENISILQRKKNDQSSTCRPVKHKVNVKGENYSKTKSEIILVTGSEHSKHNEGNTMVSIHHEVKELSNNKYNQRKTSEKDPLKENPSINEIKNNNKIEYTVSNETFEVSSPVIEYTNEELNKMHKYPDIDHLNPTIKNEKFERQIAKTEIEENISTVPSIEILNENNEFTTSTDDLDRLERKKRLESIMSRVKKKPSGSSENVTHPMTISTLQNMMEKGHLNGMSKTAAILMKNAHRSTDFNSITIDAEGFSSSPLRSAISMEHIPNKDDIDLQINRGDCDGKEDSSKETKLSAETKSNIIQQLSFTPEGSFISSWKEKYSLSDSLDSESDNSEEI